MLVIGVDSVSRLNYYRTMPRTSDLLRSHGWYELRGYNKIEDNTFPNLMAILTGMTRPQVALSLFFIFIFFLKYCIKEILALHLNEEKILIFKKSNINSICQVEESCFKTAMTPMDDCPILWRNFSRAGYVTAYVEDEPSIGTFNYNKAGFAHAPTDYYLRPFLLAAQEHMEVSGLGVSPGSSRCGVAAVPGWTPWWRRVDGETRQLTTIP